MRVRSLEGARSDPPRSPPVYLRVTEYLRQQLHERDGAPEVRLPTEAELTEIFGVSRQTARRAYADLVTQGLVVRARGKGTFASRPQPFRMSVASVDDLLAQPPDHEVHILIPLTSRRSVSAATKLGLPGDEIYFIGYRHVHQGKPFALTWIYLPPHVGAVLADIEFLHKEGGVGTEPVVSMLDRKLEHPVAVAKQLVTAVAAPADIATAIECPPHQPLLKIEYLYFDTDARPIELSINFFNPQLYEYRAQLQRRPDSKSPLWGAVFRAQLVEAPDH